MLGLYESFPSSVHKIMHFATSIADRKLQMRLTETLHTLNAQTVSLDSVTDLSIPDCTVNFEFGIAQADSFDYLDDDETSTLLRTIDKKPLRVMDFLCVARYHSSRGGEKKALRFDYCLIRFTFSKGLVSVRVFHERGPRHTSPEDIANFIVNRINEGHSRKALEEVF
jgi:hypothetical protein